MRAPRLWTRAEHRATAIYLFRPGWSSASGHADSWVFVADVWIARPSLQFSSQPLYYQPLCDRPAEPNLESVDQDPANLARAAQETSLSDRFTY